MRAILLGLMFAAGFGTPVQAKVLHFIGYAQGKSASGAPIKDAFGFSVRKGDLKGLIFSDSGIEVVTGRVSPSGKFRATVTAEGLQGRIQGKIRKSTLKASGYTQRDDSPTLKFRLTTVEIKPAVNDPVYPLDIDFSSNVQMDARESGAYVKSIRVVMTLDKAIDRYRYRITFNNRVFDNVYCDRFAQIPAAGVGSLGGYATNISSFVESAHYVYNWIGRGPGDTYMVALNVTVSTYVTEDYHFSAILILPIPK